MPDGHYHSASRYFSRLLGGKNSVVGTDTERFVTACSGCLVLRADGSRYHKTATRTASQEFTKV